MPARHRRQGSDKSAEERGIVSEAYVMGAQEGVIKFRLRFTRKTPPDYDRVRELNSWRRILYLNKLIGRDSGRYNGAAYGNVSQRIEPHTSTRSKRRFIVTGTQTGGLEHLTPKHYSVVLKCNPKQNLVVAEGPIEPSSESMTHGAVYDSDDSIRFVFHAHSPQIWGLSKRLGIPMTGKTAEYGTPEMAEEVEGLFGESDVKDKRIFSMGGHRDGVMTFGRTSEEAGLTMLKYLVKSMQLL